MVLTFFAVTSAALTLFTGLSRIKCDSDFMANLMFDLRGGGILRWKGLELKLDDVAEDLRESTFLIEIAEPFILGPSVLDADGDLAVAVPGFGLFIRFS